jgi:peptide/nickel transport system permease protein
MTSAQPAGRASRLLGFFRDFLRNREAAFGFCFLVVLTFSAIFANFIFAVGPSDLLAYPSLLPPSLAFPMGTDYIGRNMLMLMVYGARVSLFVAVGASALLALIGTVAGLLAGYLGGKMDGLIMRIADVFLTLPALPLILLVVALLGQSLTNIMLIIALTSWPFMARLIRSNVLTMMKREFIQIERVMGASAPRIVFRHLLPNQIDLILVYTSLSIPVVVLTEAAVEFLGLAPITVSWGFMLNIALDYWIRGAWWMSFFPGLMIFLTSLSFYFVSEGLREALNPRLKRRRESLVVQLGER